MYNERGERAIERILNLSTPVPTKGLAEYEWISAGLCLPVNDDSSNRLVDVTKCDATHIGNMKVSGTAVNPAIVVNAVTGTERSYRETMRKTLLATVDVARLFSVTETTVKRWADEGRLKCQKTPGGHRKFEIRNVVEFAKTIDYEPAGVLALAEEDTLAPMIQVGVLGRDFEILKKAFIEKALSPDPSDLFKYFSYLYEHRVHLWEIHDFIIRPGMEDIGRQWANGQIGINHEHRASYEVLDALAKLQAHIFIEPFCGKSVICACPEQELHEVGLRCCAYLFQSEGWVVHYLGAQTPYEAISTAIQELKPAALCLSFTIADVVTKPEDLDQLCSVCSKTGAKLLLGGRGVPRAFLDHGLCETVYPSTKQLFEYISKTCYRGENLRT